ncbi:MAG: cell division protein ZapA [Vicinamibacterales bacterium]|jgi:cell division protein ZapA
MSNRVITVEIHGQRYAVRSELDQAYIAELAAYVDHKMRLAADELSSADSLRIAVIAALNLADELHRVRAEVQGREGDVLERTAALERLVDAVLSGQQRIAV